jgi:hypothetical protein
MKWALGICGHRGHETYYVDQMTQYRKVVDQDTFFLLDLDKGATMKTKVRDYCDEFYLDK